MPIPVTTFTTPSPPAPPAPPRVRPWHALDMSWTGWDGSVWPLTDPASGVFLVAEGVRGLSMPAATHYRRRSPVLHGSTWTGFTLDDRSCFWPLLLFSDAGSAEWAARDTAFWATMHPARTGTWTVRTPSGGERTLRCRFAGDGDKAYARDPHLYGWADYGVELAAEWPCWQGQPVVRRFVASGPRDVFPAATDPWVVWISSGASIDAATLTNPGDLPAYVDWHIDGPASSVTVGVGATRITYGAPIPTSGLDIFTDPARMAAVDGLGVDRTDALSPAEFAPLDAGQDVPVVAELTAPGAGAKVVASLVPNYLRAW